jgi:hypothetical protein
MAHYAFLDENDIVTEVIVGIDESELIEGLSPETWYGNFRNQTCLRTSYNANIRGKFAGIGDSYSHEENIFIAPQPFASWVRVGSYWKAPVPIPSHDKVYEWNEAELKWDELEGTPHELS